MSGVTMFVEELCPAGSHLLKNCVRGDQVRCRIVSGVTKFVEE